MESQMTVGDLAMTDVTYISPLGATQSDPFGEAVEIFWWDSWSPDINGTVGEIGAQKKFPALFKEGTAS